MDQRPVTPMVRAPIQGQTSPMVVRTTLLRIRSLKRQARGREVDIGISVKWILFESAGDVTKGKRGIAERHVISFSAA